MLNRVRRFVNDLFLGYAIYTMSTMIARLAIELRNHFRKTPQY